MRGKIGLKPSRQAGDTEGNFTSRNYKRGLLCSQVASVLLALPPNTLGWSMLNNVPQRCSPLKPWGAWDYVTLQDKGIFTGIKLRMLRWGDCPSGVSTQVPDTRQARNQRREKMLIAGFAGKGSDQEQLSEGRGSRKWSPHNLLRGRQVYLHLDFSPCDSFWI